MDQFDDIRPYRDSEVPQVLHRMARNPQLVTALAKYRQPRLATFLPWLSKALVGHMLSIEFGKVGDIAGFQSMMEKYFEHMLKISVQQFTHKGLDRLEPGRGYVFVSNHRDIALDSAFLHYALMQNGINTCHIAIGDNLLGTGFVSDVMRLNKSFIIPRNVKGIKKAYASMLKTSRYIRHCVEQGESVWIAQREGRSKNGYDRTDVALVKMLGLAFRKEVSEFSEVVKMLNIVPVSISYELDPCDMDKTRELFAADQSDYEKPQGADLKSILRGITGEKGRVHLEVSKQLSEGCVDAEQTARTLDAAIVGGLRVFPTHDYAQQMLVGDSADMQKDYLKNGGKIAGLFLNRLAGCSNTEKPYLLAQYANVIRNKRDLGLT